MPTLSDSLSPSRPPISSTRADIWYPRTEGDWEDWYQMLHDAYVGDPYTVEQLKDYHLFRALDTSGEVIEETRRLQRDVQFVVDTDVSAMVGEGLTLMGTDGAEPDPMAAELWRRSGVPAQVSGWARINALMGDLHLEAMRDEDGAVRVIQYDPRHVRLEYDILDRTRLRRAIVSVQWREEAGIDPSTGIISDLGALHTMVREITEDEITVWMDGQLDEQQSGPHALGVVPLVHIPFLPWTEPEHGLWTALGLMQPLMLIDSFITQIKAVGNRYANPILAGIGVEFTTGSETGLFGRQLSGIPTEGDVKYLEPSLEGVKALIEAVQMHRETVRATMPEFLFVDSGANASGRALSWRAAAFKSKMTDVRGRFYGGLARAIEYAVAMADKREYDEDRLDLRVKGGPILPPDMSAELDAVQKLRDMSAIKQVDVVRHGQRLGLIDEEADADEYAAEVMDETADRAATFFGDDGGGGPGNEDEREDEDDDTNDME
jgi:hypothetical protein